MKAPERLVPGVEKYPDLLAEFKQRVATGDCTGCAAKKLATEFQNKVRARFERDKWLHRP